MAVVVLDFGSEFLDHSPTEAGSGFLQNWKEDGSIVVWFHPKAPNVSLWSHNWFRYATEKKDNEERPVIRGKRINCLEGEELLKKQRWRDKETDERKLPPAVCPHCLCVEWVRDQINRDRLEWSTPIFEFSTPDDTPLGGETITIYAGGFTGLFQRKELSESEKLQIRKSGIKQSEAFKQNGYARQQYLFAVAPHNNLTAGWVIAVEGPTLGGKVRKAIKDEVRRCNGDLHKGHPAFNPYPFEWTFDDNKEFDRKYDVIALTRQEVNAKVEELLKQEPPSFDNLIADPKLGSLYDSMKEAALIDMPFDSFFERAFDEFGRHYEEVQDDDSSDDADDEEKEAEGSSYEVKGEEEEEEETEITCDVCNTPMEETDTLCSECGAEYTVDGDKVYLSKRPCANCKTVIDVEDDGTGKCANCGAVHNDEWEFTIKEPEKPKARTRSSSRSSKGKKEMSRPSSKAQASKAASKKSSSVRKHADAEPSRRSKARAAAASSKR